MNQKLKFSWGHILAFIAIMFIGYITFMGAVYLYKGKLVLAFTAVIVIILLLMSLFIGAQLLKGTERNFKERIWPERILFVLSVVCILLMAILPISPFAHFWAVQHNEKKVVDQFKTSIEASKQMFDNYDIYAQNRIDLLNSSLQKVVANKDDYFEEYKNYGFKGIDDEMQMNNRVDALRAQLHPVNYDSLKNMAMQWIDKASQGATVWNVFMIGNVGEIKKAMTKWHSHLQKFSEKKFSIEDKEMSVFDNEQNSLQAASVGLDELTRIFGEKSSEIAHESIICALICYVCLLLPYIIQRRSVQSRYRLIAPKRTHFKPHPQHSEIEEDKDHGIIWDKK